MMALTAAGRPVMDPKLSTLNPLAPEFVPAHSTNSYGESAGVVNITDELLSCLPRLEPAVPEEGSRYVESAPVLSVTDDMIRQQEEMNDRRLAGPCGPDRP